MNFFELIPLTAAIVNLALTLFVVAVGLRSVMTRAYVVWGSAITIWNFGTYFMFRAPNADVALFWAQFLQIGVIFLPFGLYHLALITLQMKRQHVVAMYAIGVAFVAGDLTGLFVSGVRNAGYAWYSKGGPLFWIYLPFFCAGAFGTLYLLYTKQKTAVSFQRRRLVWMMIATIILVIFGTNDILPIIGFNTYPVLNTKVYPLGSLAAVFYGVMVAYSVFQYQLLDIHVVLSRFAAQMVRITFMFMIGLVMMLIVTAAFPSKFTTFAFLSALGVLFLTAVIGSRFFPQFFGKGTDKLERKILGDRFEYHSRVKSLINMMRSYPDPEVLMDELKELLSNTMKVHSYQIILVDDNVRGFMLYHSFPSRPHVLLSELRMDSPIARFFMETRSPYLSCNPLYTGDTGTVVERAARKQLEPFEPEFCFPFFSSEDLVGLMLLGPKSNDEVFTPYDLELLSELSNDLGLLLNQIRLRDQVQKAQEQELLGRMSRGLAHDLNNLLTPVHTFLQLFQEMDQSGGAHSELAPVAFRNLGTVRTYINEALFFSRTNKLNAKMSALHAVMKEAAALVQTRADAKKISIQVVNEFEATIEMDPTLITRLLSNLLSNAVDASAEGARIEIQLLRLPKTETTRDWYRVEVIDHGDGISPENLTRIFAPYFTTKNTGDETRGFGLGLAICRKIANLHGGDLSVVSKLKKGTTMRLDLPSKLLVTETTTNQTQPQPARQPLLLEHPASSPSQSAPDNPGARDLPAAPASARIAAA